MKFTIISLVTFFGLLTAVSAAPSPINSKTLADVAAREAETVELQTRWNEDHPIVKHYFSHNHGFTERDFLPGQAGTVEPIQKRWIHIVAEAVIEGVMNIVNLIKGRIEHDKDMRGQFTQDMIGKFRAKYPHYNFIMCHVKHHYEFKGRRGKDWGHMHTEFPVSFHKTIGYEIYWFREGVFHREGDGGFLNWAFGGNIKSRTGSQGRDVTFGRV